jgi:hypothetical protein
MVVMGSHGMQLRASDLFDPSLVPTPFEGRFYEHIYHIDGLLLTGKARGDTQDVGIVVFPRQLCDLGGPTQGGANILVFIGRHRRTVTTATDYNPKIRLAFFYPGGNRMNKIRIIDTGRVVCPGIEHLMSILL